MMDQAHSLDAVLRALRLLIEERGWNGFGMVDLADRAGLDLAALYRVVDTRHAVLAALADRIDKVVLAGGPAEATDPPRDRLFDVMMRRYDALAPWRNALRRLARELPRDPVAALATALVVERSLARMLEAARLGSGGLDGALRVRGLLLVHLAVLRVFVDDDTPDLGPTMRALDRQLKSVERWAGLLERFRPPGRPAHDAGAQVVAEAAPANLSQP